MTTAIIAGISLVAGALVTAVFSYLASKKRDLSSDYNQLIDQIQEELKELRVEVREMRSAFEGVKQHNSALIAYIQRLLSIIRHAGLEDKLPLDKPAGVHI